MIAPRPEYGRLPSVVNPSVGREGATTMPTLGGYCKAYAIDRFRKFNGWSEKVGNLAPIENDDDGSAQPRTSLTADDVLFLQENYVVTDGIFLDEHVVFDE